MKIISLMSVIVMLTGCASAMPNFYNGKYYMAGDSSCQRVRQYTEDKIMCIDGDGKETGWRQAMTDQQLQMWQHNQQQNSTTNTNCYRTYDGGMNCTTY
ncbi:hypothetical protein [Vibrio hibernica]|uniref:hypothetical protein n=1 Tax=Vibrio hibernica TaxID=2587465 RepID=UPI0039B0615A